jgi:hypothetical protein
MGLPTWDQPAAPCLSSRLPYGIAVTPARLRQVERAEQALRVLGFRELRVRHHDDCLRIELGPAVLERAFSMATVIRERVADTGELRVLIDAEGYRRGALNEVLVQLAPGSGSRPAWQGDNVVPVHEAAGHHGDIAVVAGRDAAAAQRAAGVLRARGFRYVALDTAAFGDVALDTAAFDAPAEQVVHP